MQVGDDDDTGDDYDTGNVTYTGWEALWDELNSVNDNNVHDQLTEVQPSLYLLPTQDISC